MMQLTPSLRTSITFESIYADALDQLGALRSNGRLSDDDYKTITTTTNPNDVLETIHEIILDNASTQPEFKKRLVQVMEPLILRLERFGAVIDLITQSSPQVIGLNLVGLVWGTIKFVVLVSEGYFFIKKRSKLEIRLCGMAKMPPT